MVVGTPGRRPVHVGARPHSPGRWERHSRRTVWNQRSTFPFVWGRYRRVASEGIPGVCDGVTSTVPGEGFIPFPSAPVLNVVSDDIQIGAPILLSVTNGTGTATMRVRSSRSLRGYSVSMMGPCMRSTADWDNGACHPACRPVAQGEFRHAVREWRTVCRRHADSRGDLPDARPGPLRLPDRGLHREHGRPCRPPAPPRLRLTPGYPGRGRTSHLVRVPN